ncbi:hypothetical protein [Micromonospora sp. NPDC049107]|uniref:hypothetical protein n=1 Tax=unclassified Micromonospora TaxID=2617518 RepID=UPI00340547C5
MSAFEVPNVHIDAMLTAGLRFAETGYPLSWYWPSPTATSDRGSWTSSESQLESVQRRRDLTLPTAGRVGAMLLAENRASVNHRYAEDEIEEPYLFTWLPGTPDPIVVLKALSCYEYQSCEHPGWRGSEAYQFCNALRRQAIGRLPRYSDAPWVIEDTDVFLTAGARDR